MTVYGEFFSELGAKGNESGGDESLTLQQTKTAYSNAIEAPLRMAPTFPAPSGI